MLQQEYKTDKYGKEILLRYNKHQVMMEWEKPYMEACIDKLQPKGDVLEIGFGMGYSATQIQKYKPKSHTIIEMDKTVIKKLKKWAKDYDNIISLRPDERKLKSLDRVFNPLEYPFQSTPYYNNSWYPSYGFAPQIIGCGRRRLPCYGDAQQVIDNNYPSRCINNQNIAPINIRTRGPRGEPQQVGTLFNLTPGNKDVLPLFGRQKFPNDGKWEYYTIIGRHGAKVPVKPLRNYQEVGTNDILQLVNYPGNFQATIYKREDLEYIPYI